MLTVLFRNYFVALVIFYGAVLVFRFGRTAFRGLHTAELEMLPGNMLKVSVPT